MQPKVYVCICILAVVLQTSMATDIHGESSVKGPRQLSWEQIAGYEPGSDVRQHNMIDLDQKEMESHLGAAVPAFSKAKQIYMLGGNSGGKATMTVGALAKDVPKGAVVSQGSASGRAKSSAAAGATQLVVSYASMCKEGGSYSQDTSGCFGTGASLTVDGTTIAAPSSVKNSYRTLAGFSTAAEKKMTNQEYYEIYKKFYNKGDYAHHFVMTALEGTHAFQGQADKARIECAKKGSAYLNVWMYVIREFEDAILDCKADCIDCNDDPVHAWDEGVAFYTGTLEGTDGKGSGKLLHALADKRCKNYGTCNADGGSAVNKEIFQHFATGQTKLLQSKCSEVPPIKKRIVELMSIPLVQGTIRYAYKVAELAGGPKEKGEGAAFAAAILPRVADCDATAGALIHENMKIDASSPMKDGFKAVKEAFEKTYACLGITCSDVGGLLESEGKYYDGAAPCTGTSGSSSSDGAVSSGASPPASWAVPLIFTVSALFVVICELI